MVSHFFFEVGGVDLTAQWALNLLGQVKDINAVTASSGHRGVGRSWLGKGQLARSDSRSRAGTQDLEAHELSIATEEVGRHGGVNQDGALVIDESRALMGGVARRMERMKKR